jgi:hypothetical protein
MTNRVKRKSGKKHQPKKSRPKTLAGFVEASKKYRGSAEGIEFERPRSGMSFRRRNPFDEDPVELDSATTIYAEASGPV